MAGIQLNSVKKVYPNGFRALHGVDLDIKDGEFMVFVGPSGCAKSTLLRMIAGLESVSEGQIMIHDRCVNDTMPKDRGIAMVFQNYALYPHMTVYKNMAFGLIGKESKAEIDRRVQDAAEKLEITNLLHRKPGQLSGGQCQRVAVGRAIVRKPKVFLFDEPLSNLDAKLRVSMRVQLIELHNRLKQEGAAATMVYVTHDQVEAMTMGDRICVMNRGTIMQVDKPINLYHHPANRFVAEFIGSPSMNLHDLDLLRNAQGTQLRIDDRCRPRWKNSWKTIRTSAFAWVFALKRCACVLPVAKTVSRPVSPPLNAWATKSCCTVNWPDYASCCGLRLSQTGNRASANRSI